MCGRYTLGVEPAEVEEYYDASFEEAVSYHRFNVAPETEMPVLTNEDPHLLQSLRWGIKPVWYKKKTGLINIRAETLREKKTFQKLLQYRRCLVPATGFYEWKKDGGKKTPYHFKLKDKEIFSFAGLWSEDKDENKIVSKNYTIITTGPNKITEEVHNRMPVILSDADEEEWLAGEDTNRLVDLLAPYPAERMMAHEVSPKINNPKNDSAELINSV